MSEAYDAARNFYQDFEEPDDPNPNCPLVTGMIPCMCDLPRCPICNYYSKHDAAYHMDHDLCSGTIPGEG